MDSESIALQSAADPVQLAAGEAGSWRSVLARLDFFQWVCLAGVLAASLLRDTRGFQWQIGQTSITIHLAILVALAIWAVFRLLASRFEYLTAGLVVSGVLFPLYAFAVDALRAPDSLGPLAVDMAFVACPIVVAAAFFGSGAFEEKDGAILTLCLLLAGILLLYMGVAYFAYSLDVGELVGPRFRNLENLSFARISGPLGGATSLCLVTIPAIAWLYERIQRGSSARMALWTAILILIVASLWTVSRVGIVLLLLLLALQFPARRILVACLVFLALALAFDWGPGQLPEKWLRLGVSDPGRVDAFGTTVAAVTSDGAALATGVGSQRLNIITRTAAAVSRGDLSFNSWATEFGTFPYGPHSILLWALGSYGLIGAALRCWFLVELYRASISLRSSVFVRAAGISSLALFLDDTHILYPFLMTIWLIFFLYAIAESRSGRAVR